MNVICAGISSIAMTPRKSVSRNGNLTHAKPYAAIDAMSSGRMVEGITIETLLMKAGSMLCCSSTAW